ncbi:hypothetical protein AYI70_g1065 [Smittium culicis]|uniref:Uncharacterized protein n=1 Tax=Smittium culicis TaxID=133412 RepID=A0A1R1YEU6_9FUNG|nr:hypothetical protein AYI70_g1065 [Smittium culicis]
MRQLLYLLLLLPPLRLPIPVLIGAIVVLGYFFIKFEFGVLYNDPGSILYPFAFRFKVSLLCRACPKVAVFNKLPLSKLFAFLSSKSSFFECRSIINSAFEASSIFFWYNKSASEKSLNIDFTILVSSSDRFALFASIVK